MKRRNKLHRHYGTSNEVSNNATNESNSFSLEDALWLLHCVQDLSCFLATGKRNRRHLAMWHRLKEHQLRCVEVAVWQCSFIGQILNIRDLNFGERYKKFSFLELLRSWRKFVKRVAISPKRTVIFGGSHSPMAQKWKENQKSTILLHETKHTSNENTSIY
jgi:hypothetical protein